MKNIVPLLIASIIITLIYSAQCHALNRLQTKINRLEDQQSALMQQSSELADRLNDAISRANTNTIEIADQLVKMNDNLDYQIRFDTGVASALNQLQK